MQLLELLAAYESCDRRDAALATFISNHLQPTVDAAIAANEPASKPSSKRKAPKVPLDDLLTKVLVAVDDARAKYRIAQFDHDASDGKWAIFVDHALLTLLLDVLDGQFGAVLVPTDAPLFHKCHTIVTRFVHRWGDSVDSRSASLLRMAVDKLNTGVYVRLVAHTLADRCTGVLRASAATYEAAVVERIGRRADEPHLRATHAFLDGFAYLWSDDVYLPCLLGKLWTTSMTLIDDYDAFLTAVVK